MINMAKTINDLRQGKYQKIIAHMRSAKTCSLEDQVALIGAHCFLGQMEQAFELWRVHETSLHGDNRIYAQFFLGIALTRISKFKKARVFLKANLLEAVSPSALSFAYQGAGFYSYFQGNFKQAIGWSQKALHQSLKAKENYIEFLAMDLLGHTVVQTGRRFEGLRLMKEANRLALLNGNNNFSAAFNNAQLIYEAEIGLRAPTIMTELQEALNHPKLADSYTHSNLILELSRQMTLRGQFEKAKTLLNFEASAIYSFGNKRQEMMLQLRLAEISYHQGEFHLMNHLLQSAKKTVDRLADKAFEIRLLGLWLKIPQDISMSSGGPEKERLLAISKEHSSLINRQILFRQGLATDPKTPIGEDPIHDLFCLAKTYPELAQEKCLTLGHLGIYRHVAGLFPGNEFLKVMDNGESFIAGSKEEIYHIKVSLSLQQLKLLQGLTYTNATKEYLIETVWGYAYDPLRHDSLIHNAIGKLRKILGPVASWIVTTDTGWLWNKKIQLLIDLPEFSSPQTSAKEGRDNENYSTFFPDDLNFRQLKALKTAPQDSGWSVGAYKKSFSISTMTAFRDLTHLHQKGLVIRTGKGRACRYLLRKEAQL
ncbi:MAG: helix-turn-helix domain-containing protein [Bacteriovorax sp.]|nr:helix-turn-helix domain-containing protein [Bacteriovorax sp.]